MQQLLGDFPLPAFLAEHYLQEPLARRDTASPFKPLASREVIDRLVENPACDLLLVRDGAVYPGERPTTAAEAWRLHGEGYTLVLRHPDRHDAQLAELGRALSTQLSGTINLHVYCTPAGHGSFGWHCDPEEVFILQTEGSKHYQLRRNTLNPAPLLETLGEVTDPSREKTPVSECHLQAGDWLYIPGGYWHMAAAPGSPSVSISVGLMPATPIDVLDFLRARLLRSPRWRERFPPLGHASAMSDAEKMAWCRELFQGLGAELQRMLQDPTFAMRFLAAAATAGVRSSSLEGTAEARGLIGLPDRYGG
jgi:ribosomal protein L16 Arg81 hydroxylase